MVSKKVKMLCFDLVCRKDDNDPPRIVNNVKIIGGKKEAYNHENHIPYLKDGETGFPINIHFEKWLFEKMLTIIYRYDKINYIQITYAVLSARRGESEEIT